MSDERRDPRDAELARLFSLAREAAPDVSGVARDFETRAVARIREWRRERETWYAWAWRLAPAFLALTILLGAWSMVVSPVRQADPAATLASGIQEVALIESLAGD